ncbi:MAG: phenylalanine--tRNA ligase subunit alpha [Candidatus Daviesbacteria bacterium]|nr:phenylalanine--tRNA ligase subunit alpha [Candidatus Daviesbacteria bacterium]
MEEKLKTIQKQYLKKIEQAESLKELDEIFLALFGKNGEITGAPKEFPKLEKENLQKIGPLFNSTKQNLEEAIEKRREEVREEKYKNLVDEKTDLSAVEIKKRQGHLHPTTQFIQETVELFKKIGFQQFDAPQIDSDFYNFEALNIPQEHPARDLWDTIYIDQKQESSKQKLLLRTHTSNSQIRIMEKYKPPFRMMSLGRCFRYENIDARHEHTFEQFELIYVDKGLSMANLLYLSEYFLKAIVGKNIKARLRPKYYPFVEPGVGIDAMCMFCNGEAHLQDGKECKVCSGTGWLEIGGAGMIHPQVLKNGNVDPNIYSGIAWGPGVGRMMMLKHGISDIRLFLSGDLRFLEKF